MAVRIPILSTQTSADGVRGWCLGWRGMLWGLEREDGGREGSLDFVDPVAEAGAAEGGEVEVTVAALEDAGVHGGLRGGCGRVELHRVALNPRNRG